MIFGKIWRAIWAQLNKFANFIRQVDPIAEMQLECDTKAEQLKDGRKGLELYRGLVERVTRQVAVGRQHVSDLDAKVRSYLATGNAADREMAGTLALEMEKAEKQLSENVAQLALHETSYSNNLIKLKHAKHKLDEVRERITSKDAQLRMGRANAEIVKLAGSFHLDTTTNFGQLERDVDEKIDRCLAEVRVATDFSEQGVEEILREQSTEKARAEAILKRFE